MADLIDGETEGNRPQKLALSKREIAARKRRLLKLLSEFDATRTVDNRSADEIIGYNDKGLFD